MSSKAMLTDKEMFALARSRERSRLTLILIIAVVSGFAGSGILTQRFVSLGHWKVVLLVLGLVAISAIVLALWFTRKPVDGAGSRVMTQNTDELQRRRSVSLLLFAFYSVFITWPIWLATEDLLNQTRSVRGYGLLGALLIVSLLHLSNLMGLPGGKGLRAVYNDELSRHLRSRALSIGFFALFCGAAGLFLFGVHEPELAVRALPLLLLYTVAVTSVSYAVMDLRADRGE